MNLFALFVDYCKEEHVIDVDENGVEIVKLGIEFITDTELLREIIGYKKGGNFDRMIAFEHALAHARELDKQEVNPEFSNSTNKKIEKHKKKKRQPSFFSNRRGKMF